MPCSGESNVTKAGSLPATAPRHAASLLRMLPGLLLHSPRVGARGPGDDGDRPACVRSAATRSSAISFMIVLLEGRICASATMAAAAIRLVPTPNSENSARPVQLAGEDLLDIGELLADFLEEDVALYCGIWLDALDHCEAEVVEGARRLLIHL